MAVNIYKDGKWHNLAGQKIWSASENGWVDVKDIDQLRFRNAWNQIGYHSSVDSTAPSSSSSSDISEPTFTDIATTFVNGTEPSGQKWYVSPNGSGDGTSWANSISLENFILQILQFNENFPSGTSVYFLEGEYRTTHQINILTDVSLYGGFGIGNQLWSARNPFLYSTSFSPESIISNHSLFNSTSVALNQKVDGFYISGYRNAWTGSANATMSNCIFENLTTGSFSCNVNNCKFSNTKAIISRNATGIIVDNDGKTKDITINGTLDNGTIINGNGKITLSTTTNAYLKTNLSNISTGNIENCTIISNNGIINCSGLKNCHIIGGKNTSCSGNITDSNISDVQGDLTCKNIENCKFFNIKRIIATQSAHSNFVNASCNINSSNEDKHVNGEFAGSALKNKMLNIKNVFSTKDISPVVSLNLNKIGSESAYGSQNESYLIDDGKLYYGSTMQSIDSGSTGWTAVSGRSNGSCTYAHGIKEGKLYMIYYKSVTEIDSGHTGWTAVGGYSEDSSSTYFCAYGIKNGQLYEIVKKRVRICDDGSTGWTAVSGCSYGSSINAYGIKSGKLYKISGTSVFSVDNGSTGWTKVSGCCNGSTAVSSVGYRYQYAYGIKNGLLYRIRGTSVNSVNSNYTGWTAVSVDYYNTSRTDAYGIISGALYKISDTGNISAQSYNSGCKSVYMFGYNNYIVNIYKPAQTSTLLVPIKLVDKSVLYNCTLDLSEAKNSVLANCKSNVNKANACTFVNSEGNVSGSGKNNVFWNCDGTLNSPSDNAQSEYNENNALTLGTNNTLTKFKNTGFYPAKGVQEIGDCPDPDTDPSGYAEWVSSFGDFHPQTGSRLIGNGVFVSGVTDDLDGNPRGNPPTLGCYE